MFVEEGFFAQLTAPFRSGFNISAAALGLGVAGAAAGWLGPYINPIVTNFLSSGERAARALSYFRYRATDVSFEHMANAGIGIVGFTLLFGTAICAFRTGRTNPKLAARLAGASPAGSSHDQEPSSVRTDFNSFSMRQVVTVSLAAGAVGLVAVGLGASVWPLIAVAGAGALAGKLLLEEGFFAQLTAPFRSGFNVSAAALGLGVAAAAGGWLGPYIRPIITIAVIDSDTAFRPGYSSFYVLRNYISEATAVSHTNMANAGIGIVGFTLLFGTAIRAKSHRVLKKLSPTKTTDSSPQVDSIQTIRWCGQRLAPHYGTEHFLVVGASGSGKTVIISSLMKSVLELKPAPRAIIYDPKQETLPYLFKLAAPERIKILHPFDLRCHAWNMAQDIDGPVSARQLATNLIPDPATGSESDSFFRNAVRDILTAVILAFINSGRQETERAWTFRDLILTMIYEPYLRFVTQLDWTKDNQPLPILARVRESYLQGDPRTTSNIRATINTVLSIHEPVAAMWDRAQRAGRTFSLEKWLEHDCRDILVLGNDESSRAAIDSINQAIFKRATELVLAQPEASRRENQTWIFLDEVREAGKLDGLSRLLTKGRSKGACIVMGFQDIDGMRNAYGEEVAQEICGQCNNIAVLKLKSPSTAEWASQLFGRYLAVAQNRGVNIDGDEPSVSRGQSQEERSHVLTSDFLYLPPASDKSGLYGFSHDADARPDSGKEDLAFHLPWNTEIEEFLPKKYQPESPDASEYCEYQPSPATLHYMKPWDMDDWRRLGFDRYLPYPIQHDEPPAHRTVIRAQPRKLSKAVPASPWSSNVAFCEVVAVPGTRINLTYTCARGLDDSGKAKVSITAWGHTDADALMLADHRDQVIQEIQQAENIKQMVYNELSVPEFKVKISLATDERGKIY